MTWGKGIWLAGLVAISGGSSMAGSDLVEAQGQVLRVMGDRMEFGCASPDDCKGRTITLKVDADSDLGGLAPAGLAGHEARIRYRPKGDDRGRLEAFLGFVLPAEVDAEGIVLKASAARIEFRCSGAYPCAGRPCRLSLDAATNMNGLKVRNVAGLSVAVRFAPDAAIPDAGRLLAIAQIHLPDEVEATGVVRKTGRDFLLFECGKESPCAGEALQLVATDQATMSLYTLDAISGRKVTLRYDPETMEIRKLVGTFADDLRGDFEATFYTGLAIDTFAANDRDMYRNPEDSGDVRERGVAGFDFAYRLLGHPARGGQLWVYGETAHGVRSTEVDCDESPNNPVCTGPKATNSGAALQIIRNATSLEGFFGLRYEVARINSGGPSSARAYLKAQAGFISIKDDAKDAVDVNFLGIGALCTKGRFKGSFLEAGVGTSHYFLEKPNGRYKLDALLTWTPRILDKYLDASPFAELTVDADLDDGPDAIQTYVGFDFDLDRLFGGDLPAGGGKKDDEE